MDMGEERLNRGGGERLWDSYGEPVQCCTLGETLSSCCCWALDARRNTRLSCVSVVEGVVLARRARATAAWLMEGGRRRNSAKNMAHWARCREHAAARIHGARLFSSDGHYDSVISGADSADVKARGDMT